MIRPTIPPRFRIALMRTVSWNVGVGWHKMIDHQADIEIGVI